MEGGRMRKYGHNTSPERSKVSTEPPPPKQQHHYQSHLHLPAQQQQQQQQSRRIPVVYYICRNRNLEHPHFIEVPISSPEGLYLRDVINRLNVLRGKGMAAMFSWSCKRSYRNGFVWHDLSEDDLILPAQGNEYVLKGSELLDTSPPDRFNHSSSSPKMQNQNPKHQHQEPALHSRSQEGLSSSSSILIKEAKPSLPSQYPHEDDGRPSLFPVNGYPEPERNLSWGSVGSGSPGLADYRVYKANGASNASSQTENGGVRRARAARDTCTRGVLTNDGSFGLEFDERRQNQTSASNKTTEISRDEIYQAPTSSTNSSGGKNETLEALIRADAQNMNCFRILEEEELFVPTRARMKATNVFLQLITCGSLPGRGHHNFGFVPTYRPRFSHMKIPSPSYASSMTSTELNCQSESRRLMGLRMEEKEFFSERLIGTKKYKDEASEVVGSYKRSSYNADGSYVSPDPTMDKDRAGDSARSKCLPITIKKQSRNETMRSVSEGTRNFSGSLDCNLCVSLGSSQRSSKRINDAPSVKGSSMRLESFKEEKEKVINIEESLLQERGL